jgi:hypothetical protein
MARVTGILEDLHGRLNDELIVCHRNGKAFTRPAHINQPHRLSRKQLTVRERQSHNNALWRALKQTGMTFFEGGNTAYNRFMAINMQSPVPYLKKLQYHSGNALLLPDMVLSDGPLPPVSYQLGEVDGQPALLTDLTPKDVRNLSVPDDAVNGKGTSLLLYILKQRVIPQHVDTDLFQLSIKVEALTAEAFITVPSTLFSPYKSAKGTLALIGDRFSDPMLGFGIVRIKDGHASRQHVVTRCTYYEQYTTEEALQAAAKSYKGLTDKG